tara:strand:- start:717 stop:905 length:189 start_codon:yes stop_codon:yes gene_type:complete
MIVSLNVRAKKTPQRGMECVPHLAGRASASQIFSQRFCLIIKTRNQVASHLIKNMIENLITK